jgi:hypothetical protein
MQFHYFYTSPLKAAIYRFMPLEYASKTKRSKVRVWAEGRKEGTHDPLNLTILHRQRKRGVKAKLKAISKEPSPQSSAV